MPSRPNILLLTSHDLGQHLNCYGIETVHSPNLDRLAAEGVLFRKSFCVAPQCCPSRAAIATGRYPHANGVMGLVHDSFRWDLHDNECHMAQWLRDLGYDTILGSFQHESRRNLEQMGFSQCANAKGLAPDVARQITGFLDQRRQASASKPFFLQLGFFEPHRQKMASDFGHPWDFSRGVTVPDFLVDEPSAREEFAAFQGGIRGLDEGVGIVLDYLDQRRLSDDTLVIFCADHGIPFPRAKCSLYDPGIEVALIMRWPAGFKVARGSTIEHLISNVDYLPTLLELLAAPVEKGHPEFHGRSFALLLLAQDYKPRDEIFAELTYHGYCDPVRAVRTRTHKLIVSFTNAPSFMDPSQSWRPKTRPKVPEDPAFAYHDVVELYDLLADPLETMNLARQRLHAEICGQLLAQLDNWMRETHDPLLNGIPTSPAHEVAMAALTSRTV